MWPWIYYTLSSFMQQKFMMPPTNNTRVNSFHLYRLYKLILSKKVVEKHYDPYKSNNKGAHPLIMMELGGDSQKQYCKLCEHGE
jgi:hypothetical protein